MSSLLKSPVFLPWLITSIIIVLLSVSVTLAHLYGTQWQQPLAEDARIFWRTVCYILIILVLPVTNLLRHIFLRLNQTMPLLSHSNLERVIQTRYTLTVSVSMLSMLFIGSLGVLMFYLGDGFNTLHILMSVAGLGIFLYRPKLHEYHQISDALTTLTEDLHE